MLKLLLATNNPGKLREMLPLLQVLNRQILTPAQLGLELDVAEVGASYAENAALKAIAFAQAAHIYSLADDSGLEVDALEGAPGLYSHRFSPKPDAADADRRQYLLEKLHGLPRPWTARFRCTVALASPDGSVKFSHGACEGEIVPQERGSDGFGYDPVFLLPYLGKTMAELTLDEKNRLSHRANAIRAAIPIIQGQPSI